MVSQTRVKPLATWRPSACHGSCQWVQTKCLRIVSFVGFMTVADELHIEAASGLILRRRLLTVRHQWRFCRQYTQIPCIYTAVMIQCSIFKVFSRSADCVFREEDFLGGPQRKLSPLVVLGLRQRSIHGIVPHLGTLFSPYHLFPSSCLNIFIQFISMS